MKLTDPNEKLRTDGMITAFKMMRNCNFGNGQIDQFITVMSDALRGADIEYKVRDGGSWRSSDCIDESPKWVFECTDYRVVQEKPVQDLQKDTEKFIELDGQRYKLVKV